MAKRLPRLGLGERILASAALFDELRKANLLKQIDATPMGWPLFGIERDQDDLIECQLVESFDAAIERQAQIAIARMKAAAAQANEEAR